MSTQPEKEEPQIFSTEPATNRIRSIIARMLLSGPEAAWWAFTLSGFHIYTSNRIPTAALLFDINTLRPVILFNQDFANHMIDPEIAFVLCHEVSHFMQMYFMRRGMRDPKLFNIAADGIVNKQVEDSFLMSQGKFASRIKPKGEFVRLPSSITNEHLYTEWIYENFDKDKSLQELMERFEGGEIFLVDDHSLWGTFNEVPDEVLRSTTISVADEATRAAGNTPSSMETLIKALKEPVVHWRQLLRNFVGQNIRIGFQGTWKRPNRRFGKQQQGKQVLRSGKGVFIIDTSGSMTDDDLITALTEVDSASRILDIWVIDCDTEVHRVYKYRKGIELKVKGRGGTNMNPALEAADKMKADFIVCITDGGLFAPPNKTRAPQLWVIVPSGSEEIVKDLYHVKMRKGE